VTVPTARCIPLAAGGQAGVERALQLMKDEIVRGLKLMGCRAARYARAILRGVAARN